MTANNQTLLAAAQAGDRAGLEALVEAHQAQVYRFAMKMCGNPDDASEVVQETLLSLARSVGDFRGEGALSTWLFTIARRNCIKQRRKGKFEPARIESFSTEVEVDRERGADGSGPEAALVSKEREQAVDKAIASLGAEQREVLMLRDVEGLSASEVADVLETSVASVKSRLHRARLTVRQRVAPLLAEPGDAADSDENCPDVLNLYSRHLEGEISADVCETMEGHVARCSRCRTVCDSLKETLSLCQRRGDEAPVPDRVQQAVKDALGRYLSR